MHNSSRAAGKKEDLGKTDAMEDYLKQLSLNSGETKLQGFVHDRFNNMCKAGS